jgi:hypothetical protein
MPQVTTKSRNIEPSQQIDTPKAVGSSVVPASMVAGKPTNNTIAPDYAQVASPASQVQVSNCTGSKRAFSSISGHHHETPGPEESDAEECPVEGSNDNKASHQSSVSNKRRRSTLEIQKAFAPTREPLAVEESQILLLRLKDESTVEALRSNLKDVPYFNNLFKEEPKCREHHLHEDSPHSIRVLLTMLNQRSAGLPTTMSVAQLSELATLCDKYNVSDIISPAVENYRWIKALWKDDKPINGDWETWLAILETFKQPTLRKKVISVLATNMFVSEGEWIIAREDGLHSISQINCWAKASLQGK